MELIEYIRLRNKMTQSEWENSFKKEEREIIILRHEGGGGSLRNGFCEWAESDKEAALITEESFAKRISLSLIWVTSRGSFTAYLDDDDLFFGHSIAVNGSPKKGLLSADIEG